MADCNNIAGEVLEGQREILKTLREKTTKMRGEADLHLRDAVELAGPESGFAKYQRGVLNTIREIEKVFEELEV
jgi:hypothetical protein